MFGLQKLVLSCTGRRSCIKQFNESDMQARTAASPGQVPLEKPFDLPTHHGVTTAHGTNTGRGGGACSVSKNPQKKILATTKIFPKQKMGLNVPNKLLSLNYHPCSNNIC